MKAAVARDAANVLVSAGYDRATDVGAQDRRLVMERMKSVAGIGSVTAEYFLMLLGHQGVKADVMVQRFLTRATGQKHSTDFAVAAVAAVANELGQPVVALEHAIWALESTRATDG